MPYAIKGKCVHKQNADGSLGARVPGGCHKTVAEAKAHMKALYAAMKKEPLTAAAPDHSTGMSEEFVSKIVEAAKEAIEKIDWAAPVVPPPVTSPATKQLARFFYLEGDRAPDGRIIDPGATNFNRPPPLPIGLQITRAHGHDGAVISGAITHVARFGNVIVGDGFIDLTQSSGRQLVELAMNGTMQTWSPDMGDAEIIAQVVPDKAPPDYQPDTHFISGTLLGFVVCQLPAMGSGVFELLNDDGSILCPAPSRGPSLPVLEKLAMMSDTEFIAAAKAYVEVLKTTQELLEEDEMPAKKRAPKKPLPKKDPRAIAACAGPSAPPASWFEQPDDPQRFLNIEDSGRVSFLLAEAGGCHIGYKNMCITPPADDDFSYFHHAQVKTDDGELVATGPVALRGGHAPEGFSALRAQAHYDDVSTGVMDVRVGYDDEGNIWAAGALRPNVTENDIARLRASGVSGDWREIDGQLRLIGICSVNTPGFPKVRLAASAEEADAQVLAIIGMGTDPDYNEECEDCFEVPTLEERVEALESENTYLREVIASAGLEDALFDEMEASLDA